MTSHRLYSHLTESMNDGRTVHTLAEMFARACSLHQAGDLASSEQLYEQVLQLDPQHADAALRLGSICAGTGRLGLAVSHYQQALSARPGFVEAHNHLGVALAMLGRLDEADHSFRLALSYDDRFAEAYNNMGIVLAMQGRLEEAAASYRHALGLEPGNPDAHNNLGLVLRNQGHLPEAVQCFEEAVRLRPEYVEAYHNLGLALADLNQVDKAVRCYRQALHLNPAFARSHATLGELLKDQGMMTDASYHFEQALRLQPTAKLHILNALMLPPIYESTGEVGAWRERLAESVRRLQEGNHRFDMTQEAAPNPFYLVYQGKNDCELQRAIASLYSGPPDAPLPGQRSRAGKIRVGFISRCLKNHTIGRLMRGTIAHLTRDLFSVTVLSVGSSHDEIADFLRQYAEHYVEVPLHLPAARQIIASQELDILFYTDIGLDPVTYSLAFSRLAPVQCVTWGHPVTTGIPAIDYFISSDLLEESGAESHYTEKLVRLKNLAIYYYRPPVSISHKGPAAFGLPEGRHLYGCPQTLFKFHPDFDAILEGILVRDPLATVFLIEGKYRHWDEILQSRFARTLPHVFERIQFLPTQNYDNFLSLMALADVLLDPIHFGGGNTSYEGLAAGVPIVTMPSEFLRGRITFALYKQMNLMDCVVHTPEEYVNLAVRLGTDVDYRLYIRSQIAERNEVLFENASGIRELEQFFLHSLVGGGD